MADGSIVFDTELNPEGLNEGLNSLGESSGASLKSLSDTINRQLSDAFGGAVAEVKLHTKAITDDAIAMEKSYGEESERVQNKRINKEAEYIQYLRDNLDKIKGLKSDELKCLQLSYELGIISAEEYYLRLETFRDRYFSQGSAEWLKYTGEILEHNQKLATEQQKALTKAADETTEHINKVFEELDKKREKLSDKISSYGGISHNNRIVGDDIDIEYVSLSDINKRNKELEEYLKLMTKAQTKINNFWRTDTDDAQINEKNKDLRNSYFGQMRDMSIQDATDFARALLGNSEADLFSHLSAFEERERLADEISKLLYSSEVSDVAESAANNLGQDFSDALIDELQSLSGKFFTSGQSACESFGKGFMSSLNAVLAELSKSISIGVSSLGYGNVLKGSTSNVENNTSYNIYNPQSPADTIRLLREQEELKRMMIE